MKYLLFMLFAFAFLFSGCSIDTHGFHEREIARKRGKTVVKVQERDLNGNVLNEYDDVDVDILWDSYKMKFSKDGRTYVMTPPFTVVYEGDK